MNYADLLAEKRKKESEKQNAVTEAANQSQNTAVLNGSQKSNNMLSYLGERALLGVTGAMEGLYDFTVGGVAQLIGRKDIAEKVFNDDVTGQYRQLIEEKYNANEAAYSIGSVIETVSNMLPSVAANIVAPGVGLGVIGAQAAGQGVTQAYQNTGELGAKEWGYGALSGASEIAIEKISGGLGGLGNGWVDDVAKKLVSNGVVRGMIGEGLEEVASTALDPILKRITYDKNAANSTAEEYEQSFILGAVASGILQGGAKLTSIPAQKNIGNKIIEQNKAQEVIDKALELKEGEAYKTAQALKTRLEQGKSIAPISIGKLALQYNADFAESNIKDIQKNENVNHKQAEKIFLESIIAEKENPIIEKAVAEKKISRKTIKQIMDFSKAVGTDIEFIDDKADINGYYKDGKLYINVNNGDVAYKTAVHEQLHNLEYNNKEKYNQLKEAITELAKNNPEIKSKIDATKNTYKNSKADAKLQNNSDANIDNEAIINVATELIKEPEKLNKAITIDKTYVERIADFLKGIAERAKSLFDASEQKHLNKAYNSLVAALYDKNNVVKTILNKNASTKYYSPQNTNVEGISYSLKSAKTESAKKAETAPSEIINNDTEQIKADKNKQNSSLRQSDKVLVKMPETYKAKGKEWWANIKTGLQISFTNEFAGIENELKRLGVTDYDVLVQELRAASSAAQEMIFGNQYDAKDNEVGRGLVNILEPVRKKGEKFTQEYFAYLLHMHNIDRLKCAKEKYDNEHGKGAYQKNLEKLQNTVKAYEEKISALKNINTKTYQQYTNMLNNAERKLQEHIYYNAVFYNSAEDSKKTAKQLLTKLKAELPEIEKITQELYKYQDNLLQYRVDTGLITQKDADNLRKIYPHYVPTFRNTEAPLGTGAIKGKYNLEVKKTIKHAEGSDLAILPIDSMIAKSTMEVIKAAKITAVARKLQAAAASKGDYTNIQIKDTQKASIEELDGFSTQAKNNEITYYDNGKKVTIKVSKPIFYGFDALSGGSTAWITDNSAYTALHNINSLFKKLVTAYNPAFTIRNIARDFQEAGINSTDIKGLLSNYAPALKEIANNGKYWRLYKAKGGLHSSLFDLNKINKNNPAGFKGIQNAYGLTAAEGNLLNKLLQTVENINIVMEQAPRLAEFMASIKRGESASKALLNAADVTINFGRTGRITKILNNTIMPFLNPALQGFSKIIRNVTTAKAKHTIARLVIKCVILGVAPQLLQMLMYWDDEDYQNLNARDKENNYLFKIGDKFIKIPKGRIISVLAGATQRTGETFQGNKNAWDGYLSNVSRQISPVENISRTIFSPIKDVATNTTWYGTPIEGKQFETVEPKKRYDENTSQIAIALGKVINYSPKKIHYLLDQYSGVIGDFILPATTNKAEKDFISGNFTIDPVEQNNLSTEFYKIYDEANYAKSNGDTIAACQVKYLKKVKDAVNELYSEKSKIENSELSDDEKRAEVKTIQILINEAYKTAINDYELISNAFEATQNIEDEEMRYIEGIKLVYGAERALREYDNSIYEKAKTLSNCGIDYDTYYNAYFAIKNIKADTDKDGNTIIGSRKTKVIKEIAALDLTVNQKLLLIMASGYTIQDGEIKGIKNSKKRVAQYIANLKISKEQKIALAEVCGFKVKDGKIVLN